MKTGLFLLLWGFLFASGLGAADAPEVPWRNVGPGGGGWIQSMLASRHGQNVFFVGCDVGGFYRSEDGGTSYAVHNEGFEDYFIECLAEHPADPKIIYAGCKSGVYKSADGGLTWRWLREGFPPVQEYAYSAMVSKIVLDPRDPETVYAAIGQPREERGGQGAIYKSADGGATWRQLVQAGQLPPDLLISDLAVHPLEPRRLLIATPRGLFASADGGATWTASNEGLPPHLRTRRLAQSPSDPQIVYVSLKGKAGESPWQAGVYRSEDGGRTWRPRVNGLRQATGKPGTSDMLCSWVDALAVHPQQPEVVYAGGATWWDATVYKTEDGGLNWRRTFEFGEKGNARHAWIDMWGPSVTCLTLSPRHPDTLLFGTSGYIYRTDDGGATWRQRYTQERSDGRIGGTGLEVTCLHGVFPHPRVKGRVFFGFYDVGLLVSDDGGATMRRRMAGVPGKYDNSCFTVAFAEDDDAHVWAGFGQWGQNAGMIAESRDNGQTWVPLNREGCGLPDARPRHLISCLPLKDNPARKHRLLCVAEGQGVFASADDGATWSACNAGLPAARVSCLARDTDRPNVFYAGVSSGGAEPGAIFRSDDGCARWRQVSGPGVRLAQVRQLAARGGRVYATVRSAMVGPQFFAGGVFRGDEGGTVWRQVYTNRYCEAVAIDPLRADRVYASLHDHPYHDRSTGGGVIASADGGATWRPLTNPTLSCKGVTWISVDPLDPERLWLGTGGNAAFTGAVGGVFPPCRKDGFR
ncbi:MAG TPA: hypothetical protein PKM57_06385 [Kiritimatiellia bacterium]|nr:hypothetical protein [Kiritimatiellia bacterium]HPS08639.1 hypothetical protein [Kiritimatiellia bacterium]